jgi:hypothetical protein
MALTVASCGLGFNVPFNVLDHHDGVVDHNANGQHQANVRVLIRYPEQKKRRYPQWSGHPNSGINDARQVCKKDDHHQHHSTASMVADHHFRGVAQNQVGSYDAVTQPGTENSKLVNNLWTGPTHLEPGAWKTAMAEASLLFRDCARHTTQHSTANVWMDHTPWRALDDDVGKLLLDRWAALGIHNWNSVPLGAGRRRRFN